MPTTLIKDKLSSIVISQLPEFIQNDYPTFITFIEAYYKFLEQDQGSQEILQNIFNYNDVDQTIDSFITYFKKMYLHNVPETNLADPALLIKNIKYFSSNKGSEKSYTLLLGMLLNKKVNFSYPGRNILIASDGRWKQDVSMFVQVLTGTSNDIVGQQVRITSAESTVDTTFIKEKKEVVEVVGEVEQISNSIFEYFFDNTNNTVLSIGDYIEFENFRGVIVATTTSVSVVSGGSNFKVGQTFSLVSGDGRKSVLRVTEIGSGGSISKVELIQFGIGYSSVFLSTLTPGNPAPAENVFFISSGTFYISESLDGFLEQGFINRYTYTGTSNPAFDISYCGEILRTFFTDSRVETEAIGDLALVRVDLGAKAKYPGYFKTNNGFLSDEIYLQDRDYYQPYSYVLEIDEQLKKYKKAVLDILHPAGMKLFGNFLIRDENFFNPTITTTVATE